MGRPQPHGPRSGHRLQTAAKNLAACKHPEDQHQYMRASLTESIVVRCSDCGALAMADDLSSWTRPMLVAHVVGAVPR